MLINEEEVNARMESPLNLFNKFKVAHRIKGSFPIVMPEESTEVATIPTVPVVPRVDDLIHNLDDKIKFGKIQQGAADIIQASIDQLKLKIEEVDKPEKYAVIANQMNGIITSINTARSQNHNHGNKVQIMIYAPQLKTEDAYEMIEVRD